MGRPASFGESVVSEGGVVRQNSNEKALKNKGSASSSRAGSRQGSRQGSFTDLASVTSDYDEENTDPDGFAKPAHGQKVRSQSAREIKRPEVFVKPSRTRSVLSSNNL